MPYVSRTIREEIAAGRPPFNVGELTYVLQQAVNHYLMAKHPIRFRDLAGCIGALEACKADFTNRVLTHYEHGKELENGDVWDPALIEQAMGLRR